MAEKNKASIQWDTPWFTARFPKLQQPDTQGQFADGKFKTDAIFDPAVLKDVEATLQAAAKKLWPDAEVEVPIKAFYANKDDKAAKKNPQGCGITMKSQRKPLIWDGSRNPIPDAVKIGGGSILRAKATISPYSKTEKVRVKGADGKMTTEDTDVFGITIYVNAVQVRKLVEGSQFVTAFDEDPEGFTYEGAGDDSGSPFGDATDL